MNLLPPPLAPLTEADARPPRPGWAKGLGVGHVVVATLSSLTILASMSWLLIAAVTVRPAAGAPSLLMGMDHPRYLAFILADGLSGLVLNGYTFAAGLALLNLRSWGARAWEWLAPAKIARLVVIWGGFVVFVAPPLAARVGETVVQIMQQQVGPGGRRFPMTAAELSLIYAWMFLAMGIGMIVLGSAYPAVTWWIARRRGLRGALVDPQPAPGAAGLETVP